MLEPVSSLPKLARYLGLAGLLPQAWACWLIFSNSDMRWIALAGAFGYAAFIFSFLGGVWWGVALTKADASRWIYAAAVAPSLISFGAYIPWALGWSWPQPSLTVIGFCLLISPVADHAIGRVIQLPRGWLALRWQLSIGLGVLTLFAAILPAPGSA